MLRKINVMLDEGAYMPERAHEADAGLDIRTPKAFILPTGSCVTIDTGVHVEIPNGYVGMLKSKSGLNVKYGITGEGVIDAGYSGSIVVKLYRANDRLNCVQEPLSFEKGDKIIQLVIMPIETPVIYQVQSFSETDRGNNGFGSTGR